MTTLPGGPLLNTPPQASLLPLSTSAPVIATWPLTLSTVTVTSWHRAVGAVVSATVIVESQAAELPSASLAVHVRVITEVVPQPGTDVSLCVRLVTPTLSVAVALPVAAGSVESPHSTVVSPGQLITGGSLSPIAMFCGQLALLPHASVAVQVRRMPVPVSVSLCVTVGFGLRNFSDKEVALGEMARVVRPGGRVVILDMVPLGGRGVFHQLLRVYFRGVVPRLGALLAGNKEAYTYLPDSVDSFLTAQELSAMMESVGLQKVRYEMMGMGTVAIHVGEKSTVSA